MALSDFSGLSIGPFIEADTNGNLKSYELKLRPPDDSCFVVLGLPNETIFIIPPTLDVVGN